MKTITRVSEKSLANLFGIFGVFYGLVTGVLLTVFSSIGGSVLGTSFVGFGILSIILAPIAYGVAGYLSGYVGAGIYNKLIVPKFGGIEIELE
ncbi:hypothetical protein HYV89_02060 [Candidatus Woesearchaeota archaeon]|nr:hypothetical protein [Candidatus Woesearchaeota archaeon]